jgi:microcystin-dependent protein
MSDNFVGEIRNFAFGQIPQGWVACNGQALPVSQYQVLYALLGTTFGGNGRTTFNVPDLRGRVPVGADASFEQGATGGSESVTLTLAQLPSHTHAIYANATAGSVPADIGNFLSVNTAGAAAAVFPAYAPYATATATPLASTSVTPACATGPHENRQPTLTTSFCIATTGLYPTRS